MMCGIILSETVLDAPTDSAQLLECEPFNQQPTAVSCENC